jgi:hypothetical protein
MQYKEDQKRARLAGAPQPTTKLPIGVKLGIRAFKRANPGVTQKDIRDYKRGAWAKIRELTYGT